MKRLLVCLSLLASCLPVSAQVTQSQVQNTINTNITANGHGAITGPVLNNVLTQMNSAIFNPGSPLIVQSPTDSIIPGIPVPSRFGVYNGTPINPITGSSNPGTVITRVENITSGSANPFNTAMLIVNEGLATTTLQLQGQTALLSQAGNADAVGFFSVVDYTGSLTHGSFGAYFEARGTGPNSAALGIETTTVNNSGSDRPWVPIPAPGPGFIGYDITYGSSGSNLGGAAVQVRTNNAMWDVGYAVAEGNFVKTADFVTYSQSITSFLDKGSHTNGIDLSGGSYSGNAFKSTGFSVDATGDISAISYSVGATPTAGVSCSGNVSPTTMVIINGIVTHC